MAEASNERASPSASPPTAISGRPLSSVTSVGSRTANTMAIGLGQQAPGHERQRLCGRPIEPLRIVDQAHERTLLGRLGQQTQDRERDEEAIRCRAVVQPERRPQRVTLRAWQPVELAEHRRAQLMQPGERELHLRLNARDPGDATLRGPLGDVLQQRRLADPRLAAQHLHRALPRPDALQLAVQCLALDASPS